MIIYHGAINKDIQLVTKQKINCLVTYAAYKKHEWKPWWKNLFIDSGAFSVHNSGKTIDIEKYAEYLLEWETKKKPIVYASLDVIGDEKESFKNYKYLLKKKLNPMPCFHYGEPFEVLKKYADMTNVIGLGALVGLSTKRRRFFLDKVFSLYPDPKEIGFHGFGVTTPTMIKQYPWYSIDSTLAMRCGSYKEIQTPWGRFILREQKDHTRNINIRLGKNTLNVIKNWAKKYEVDWDKMINNDDERYKSSCRIYLSCKSLEEIFPITNYNSKYYSLLGL